MSKLIAPARLIQLRAAYQRAREGSEYWRMTLPDVPVAEIGVGTLSAVPIHTSQDLSRLGHALRIRSGIPDSVRFTGGTTSSRVPVCRVVNPSTPIEPPGESIRGLGLTPTAGVGGPHGLIPSHFGLLQAPMRHRSGYAYAAGLLTQHHDFPGYTDRIRFMAMPLPMLKRLVYVMADLDCGPDDVAVQTIMTWGYHLSSGWRQRIEAAFPDAKVHTAYGFTEAIAQAPSCRDCGAFHYGPDAVWEVLDPLTEKPVPQGLGRMVVTPLSDRDTMLFRYAPGDMVLRTAPCELVGEPGFLFAGREGQMIPVQIEGRQVFPVWPVHVQEAVDSAHWIERHNAPRHGGMTPTEGDGHPMWRIVGTHSGQRIAVELQLQYDPRLFPDAWDRHRARALESLVASSPTPHLLQGESAVVDLVGLPPGSMDGTEIFRC